MGRLYYEKQQTNLMNSQSSSTNQRAKNYLEKVSSIVPAEVVAGYLTMVGFLDKNPDTGLIIKQNILIGVFAFCLVLTPIYFYFQADKNRPKFIHILVSTLAFLVWAFVISGEKFDINFYDADLASILLVGFSLISGLIPMKK